MSTLQSNPDKYARSEYERRFLLERTPGDLDLASGFVRIIDHYLPDSRLRMRRMETPAGQVLVYKMTQKFSRPEQPPHLRTITNLYLNAAEYAQLRVLGGRRLVKRRYPYDFAGLRFSIDVFEERLAGLVLAEIEAPSEQALLAIDMPAIARKEVTADPSYEGGCLVLASAG